MTPENFHDRRLPPAPRPWSIHSTNRTLEHEEAARHGIQNMNEDGLIPCSGYKGYMCPRLAVVRPKRKKCESCWTKSKMDIQYPEPIEDPWSKLPVAPPVIDQLENATEAERNAHSILSAERLAKILGQHGERGFENFPRDPHLPQPEPVEVLEDTLYRLARIADPVFFPSRELKSASRCGGVQPQPPNLPHIHGRPLVADAGDATYAWIVRRLIWERRHQIASNASAHQKLQISYLEKFRDEALAEICKAALAAGAVAHAAQSHLELSWSTLQGGVWTDGDLPT